MSHRRHITASAREIHPTAAEAKWTGLFLLTRHLTTGIKGWLRSSPSPEAICCHALLSLANSMTVIILGITEIRDRHYGASVYSVFLSVVV